MSEPARPTGEEAAAIAAAVALWSSAYAAQTPPAPPARAWALAMRLPDLEIDDLRALARARDAACSARF